MICDMIAGLAAAAIAASSGMPRFTSARTVSFCCCCLISAFIAGIAAAKPRDIPWPIFCAPAMPAPSASSVPERLLIMSPMRPRMEVSGTFLDEDAAASGAEAAANGPPDAGAAAGGRSPAS